MERASEKFRDSFASLDQMQVKKFKKSVATVSLMKTEQPCQWTEKKTILHVSCRK